jgi:NifU-like protein
MAGAYNYSAKVVEHFLHPRNLGTITETEIDRATERLVTADAGVITRGDALKLSLRIRSADETIVDARFLNFGTGVPIASASYVCSTIVGKKLADALKLTAEDLDRELEGVPELKSHQHILILEALATAAHTFRGEPVVKEAPKSNEPLVCYCFQVPGSVIERAIRLRGLTDVGQVTSATHAGGGCHTCHWDIEEILKRCEKREYTVHIPEDEYYAAHKLYGTPMPSAEELAHNPKPPNSTAARAPKTAPDGFVYPDKSPVAELVSSTVKRVRPHKPWTELSREERLAWIEDVLEYDLRPAIRTDGGDVKLMDLKDNRVLVSLHGHCKNCHSALSTLKLGIEKRLQEAVWPELEIEEVFTP